MTMEKVKTDVTIIGAGLTGLTTAFYLSKAGLNVTLLEKQDRIGGVIQTMNKKGFIFETGPNTGVYSTPELVRLFDDLEGTCSPEFAHSSAKQRWILKNGKWHALPSGLISAVRTPLFTLGDKFRILGEPFRKKGKDPYETVANLVRRRMGNSFLDYAVDPFISGIYAGDPEKLVTQFALPKLYRLEQTYGSFIGGSIKKRREPRDELTRRATREVFSVKGGLQQLTDGLAKNIGPRNILTNISDLQIHQRKDKYLASFSIGGKKKEVASENIVTTVPGPALGNMFSFMNSKELRAILELRYAKVVQVIAAYRTWSGIPLQAFGGLIPSREKRNALGILFTSSIFSGRTPEGGAILSVFMGGDRQPEIFSKTDQQIREMALNLISEALGSGIEEPDLLEIYRYEHAIPQYEASTEQRLETIRQISKKYPGIHIAGNVCDGIGMADRVKQGYLLAKKISNLNDGEQI